MKLRYKIILLLLVCAVSFFAGRLTTKTKETIKYVKGETIHETIEVPKYIYETIPSKPVFKTKTDTLYVNEKEVIVQTVDTGAIIQNYISERRYAFNVFDNENGKLDVRQTIQYNELRKFDYTFTPTRKEIISKMERIVIPFAGINYNSFNQAGVGAGVFYRNIGFEMQYMRDLNTNLNGYGIGLKIKF